MSFAISKMRINPFRGIFPKTIQRNVSYFSLVPTNFPKQELHNCGKAKRNFLLISNRDNKITSFKSSCLGFSALRLFSSRSDWINQQNAYGDTALHVGVKTHASESRYEICKFLLENHANPNIADFAGKTPLDTATLQGSQDMIELLISYGALRSNK